MFEAPRIRSHTVRAQTQLPKLLSHTTFNLDKQRGIQGGAQGHAGDSGTAGSRSHSPSQDSHRDCPCEWRLCRLPPQLCFIRAEPTQDLIEIRVCKHSYKIKYKICRYLQPGKLHRFRWFRVYYLQIIQQRKWTLWINAHLLAIWKNNKDLQLYFSLLFCLSTLLNSSISFNLLPATFQLLKRVLMRACSCAMPNVLWIWKVLKTSKNMPFLPLPSKEKNQSSPQQDSISDFRRLSCSTGISTPHRELQEAFRKGWENVGHGRRNQGLCRAQRSPALLCPRQLCETVFSSFHSSILPICPWMKGWPVSAVLLWLTRMVPLLCTPTARKGGGRNPQSV